MKNKNGYVSEIKMFIKLDDRVKGVNKVEDFYTISMSFGEYNEVNEYQTRGAENFIPSKGILKSTNSGVEIKDVILKNERTKWQLKLTLGICSAMLIGELVHLPRTMWIGFSCMSVLQPTQDKLEFRYKKRPIFLVIGCFIFGIFYLLLPKEFINYIGIIGGLMIGLSATYQWQTVFNCFGALTVAVPIFGLEGAIILRIFNNVFGVVYSNLFNNIFDIIDNKVSARENMDNAMEG